MNNIDLKNHAPYLGLPSCPREGEKLLSLDQAEIFKNLKAQALRREPVKLNSIRALTDERLRFKLGKVIGDIFKKPIDIEDYEISDSQIAFKIAKYNATKFPQSFCFSPQIKKYNLDSTQRFELAKQIAKEENSYIGLFISRDIKGYNLNQQQRFEIAKIVASSPDLDISKFIKNFELDLEQRFEIAKIAATKQKDSFSKFIKNYELDLEQRFEIAKITAIEKDYISWYIKNYELDLEQRFEIAIIVAPRNSISPYIQNYELTPEQRYIIAKIDAAYGDYIFRYIEEYQLNSKQRFEVTKICFGISDANKYKLKNSEHRFEVAQIAAKSGKNIFKYFDIFEIKDYEHVVELAKLSISSNPKNADAILTYPFKAKDYRKILLLLALVNKDLTVSKDYIKRADSPWLFLLKKINKISIEELSGKKQQKAKEKLTALEDELKEYVREKYSEQPETNQRMLTWIESSCKSDNLLVRKRLLSWTTNIVGLCNEQDLSSEEYEFLFPILENLATLPDPTLRGKLSFKLMTCFLGEKNGNLREWQKQLVGNQTRNQRPVVAMLLSPLANAGEEEAALRFIDTFYSNKQLSAAGTSQRTVIDLLMNLNQKLSFEEQASLLTKLVAEVVPPTKTLPPIAQGLPSRERKAALKERARQRQLPNRTFTEMLNSAQIANDLLLLGKGDSLKEIATRQDINTLMEDFYLRVLGGEKSDTFTANYLNSFGKFRDKQAIWTYYANLQNLSGSEKDETLSWFKIYMQSVLEGTFKERRYENDHLDTVFESWPSLEDTWKEGGMSSIADLATTGPAKAKDTVSQLFSNFKEAILRHKHLGNDASQKYPHLVEFLKNQENRESILKELELEREGLLKQEKTDKQKNKALLANLRFQKCLLDMFEPQANIERHLAEAVRIAPDVEFKNDLKGALHLLEAPAVNAQSLIAVDTDDPCDFLLMGNEVEGSCQRLDGSPELNRGLLGTALNGQTRMIAVKSEGKIVARALMRLLWDKKGKKPVLYLEPVYTSSGDPKVEQMVIEMAKKRAKQLDLPLLTEYQDKPSRYPHKIYSLDGQCPFEYVDALSAGEVISPTFSIKKSSFLT